MGTVTLLDGLPTLGTGTLNAAGVATFTTLSLTLGQHTITAVYGGDANNPGSTSPALTETILASNPVPLLTSLSPSSTNAGSGAFTLTVTGSNFMPGCTVVWNGSNRVPTYFSGGTQLQVAITAADIASAGSASIMVSNPAPGGGTSNSENFQVLETFSGTGGYLSMFLSGANLGNSVLYQRNGLIGLGTTSPQAALDVNLTTNTAAAALNTNTVLGNSSALNGVATSMNMTFVDASKAQNLSKQTARMIYMRDSSATGGVSAFDSILTTGAFLSGNAPYQLRGLNIEGPWIGPGKTLSNYTGLLISSPYGGGTVGSTFAILTAPNSGNVGFGTLGPATALQVAGDIRVGTAGSNGCLQNFSGTALAGTCSSDARLKTNVLPFAPILDKLVKLQPVHFDWKTQEYPEYHFGPGRNSGLLAQEVEKVFPEMVATDERGYKLVNYSELPYLTLAAIRELRIENDTLREQLAARQRELQELRQQVVAVGARLARLERPRSHKAKRKAAATAKPKRAAVVKPEF
jgi:hypothetical protein